MFLGVFRIFWDVCDLLGCFATSFDFLDFFGTFWDVLGPFGTVWDVLRNFGTFWDCLTIRAPRSPGGPL